jgi:homoserine O-acetyltransferase
MQSKAKWTEFLVALGVLSSATATAAPPPTYPAPVEADWIVKDFRFHDGQVAPALRLHYATIGNPAGEAVLVLHGTSGSGAGFMNPAFAGELFGPGQPLDAARYFLIFPDAIGAGKSAKPSDGLRAKFPAYNYDDMVEAQHRLLTEHLGIKHLRLIIGNSMGGMQTWMWAQKYPGLMDIAVPMASLPTAMSGRNWMLRRLFTESIRQDPDWKGGNYTTQPPSFHRAVVFFGVATSGGNQGWYKRAPTREQADKIVDEALNGPFTGDANDYIYQWESSRDYNPAPGLERITATVLAINAADDERNPPELGVLDEQIKRIKHGRVMVIPASSETTGHGTTASAKFYKQALGEVLESAPRLGRP